MTHAYPPGTTLTFDNHMIGCVTAEHRLTLISPQGWVRGAKSVQGFSIQDQRVLPKLADYLKTTKVVKAEMLPPSFFY